MKSLRAITASSAAAAIVGCGAAINWEASCGCAPLWPLLAQELQFAPSTEESGLTPDAVATHMRARLAQQGETGPTLTRIRAVGAISHDACFRKALASYRCEFWLWDNGSEHRGIQLHIDGIWTGSGTDWRVTGRYVQE